MEILVIVFYSIFWTITWFLAVNIGVAIGGSGEKGFTMLAIILFGYLLSLIPPSFIFNPLRSENVALEFCIGFFADFVVIIILAAKAGTLKDSLKNIH